jgi:hypothetical protein
MEKLKMEVKLHIFLITWTLEEGTWRTSPVAYPPPPRQEKERKRERTKECKRRSQRLK